MQTNRHTAKAMGGMSAARKGLVFAHWNLHPRRSPVREGLQGPPHVRSNSRITAEQSQEASTRCTSVFLRRAPSSANIDLLRLIRIINKGRAFSPNLNAGVSTAENG